MSGMEGAGFSAPDSAPGWFGKPASYWIDLPKLLEGGFNAVCFDMGDWLPPAMTIDFSDPRARVWHEPILRGDPDWFDFAWPPEQWRFQARRVCVQRLHGLHGHYRDGVHRGRGT